MTLSIRAKVSSPELHIRRSIMYPVPRLANGAREAELAEANDDVKMCIP